ncbi:hypothetical protein [Natronobacterium texcoconense]|uniref:Uncharacterized protein n=1 Tax=Natronobacterium texcoconense TaxID=1095778 RepID=A0A1H1HTS7_NATTX|nr:hypothetical protein [Natronobacterium texcoconense]SDR28456.1 hypothetical protein SAMN04489842_3015 [Natronobacterium texcoconense]
MNSRPIRSWLIRGIVLGTLVGVVGYALQRTRSSLDPSASGSETDVITERHATAALVRRRVDPAGLESLREHVAETVVDGDPNRLLGLEAVTTASLFLTGEREEPELVWYVEGPRSAAAWDDRQLENAFPIDHEAILEDGDQWIDRELLVHAVHPERPRTATGGERLVASGDELERDVELVRLPLESGYPERLAEAFAGVTRRVVDGELELDRIENWSAEMLEAEAMFTESIFLERSADGYTLWQYMEAEDMDGVYEAYYDTWNPVARVAEVVVGRVLEEPDRILSLPLGTDTELLAHAVDPDRPLQVEDC